MFGDNTLVPLLDEIFKFSKNRPDSSKSEIDLIDQKPVEPVKTRSNPSKPDRNRRKSSKIGEREEQQIER